MRVAPLEWPPAWRGEGRHKGFLLGVPFVGPQVAIWRDLKKQLAGRDSSALAAWGGDEARRTLAHRCSEFTRDILGWPNAYFVPDDPFEIVTWNHRQYPVDDLRTHEIVTRLEADAGVRQSDPWWESAITWTYGAVIDAIRAESSSGRRGA